MPVLAGSRPCVRWERDTPERAAQRSSVRLGHVQRHANAALVVADRVERRAVVGGLDPRPDALLYLTLDVGPERVRQSPIPRGGVRAQRAVPHRLGGEEPRLLRRGRAIDRLRSAGDPLSGRRGLRVEAGAVERGVLLGFGGVGSLPPPHAVSATATTVARDPQTPSRRIGETVSSGQEVLRPSIAECITRERSSVSFRRENRSSVLAATSSETASVPAVQRW